MSIYIMRVWRLYLTDPISVNRPCEWQLFYLSDREENETKRRDQSLHTVNTEFICLPVWEREIC
jgi:hypothetical protein